MNVHEASRPDEAGTISIFDEVVDRKGSNSIKWGGGRQMLSAAELAADPLPMWIADMDFRPPQPVLDALADRVRHGVFGYGLGWNDSYLDAVAGWQGRRFGWQVAKDWIIPTSGVVTALKTAILAFSSPGDTVLIQPPVYTHFHTDPLLLGRHLVTAPLELDGDRYRFDPRAFEAAIRDNTRIFILCNPHNPTGNVWTEAELREMGEICYHHGVLVVSDEIHQDLVINPARRHIPFASLGPDFAANSITCTAPSKTFNLAGLKCANVIVPDRRLRGELLRRLESNMSYSPNVMGVAATEAAYAYGEAWLTNLLAYVGKNRETFSHAVNAARIGIRVLPADALYLAWMDCRGLGLAPETLNHFLLTGPKVWLDRGQKFGEAGHGFMRANLACPRSTVDKAIARLLTCKAAI